MCESSGAWQSTSRQAALSRVFSSLSSRKRSCLPSGKVNLRQWLTAFRPMISADPSLTEYAPLPSWFHRSPWSPALLPSHCKKTGYSSSCPVAGRGAGGRSWFPFTANTGRPAGSSSRQLRSSRYCSGRPSFTRSPVSRRASESAALPSARRILPASLVRCRSLMMQSFKPSRLSSRIPAYPGGSGTSVSSQTQRSGRTARTSTCDAPGGTARLPQNRKAPSPEGAMGI